MAVSNFVIPYSGGTVSIILPEERDGIPY